MRAPNAAVVIVLGLTAGLTAAGFDVVASYLWRPLPYPESHRLVAVDYPRASNLNLLTLEKVDWSAVRDFADLALSFDVDAFTVLGGDTPFSVDGRWMTADVFAMFGVVPAAGRFFTADEARRGEPLAVISHAVWQEHFGGRASALGSTITARATIRQGRPETYSIVGVLPPGFWHLEGQSGLILPLKDLRPPSMLRLKDGITSREAASRLTPMVQSHVGDPGTEWRVAVRPAQEAHVAGIRGMLLAALAAMGLLGLAAIASLLFLHMARGVARQRDYAVRTVLGASRAQLVRAMLREGLIVGTSAAIVAVITAFVLLRSAGVAVEQYLGRLVPGGASRLGSDAALWIVSVVATIGAGVLLAAITLASARVASLSSTLAGHPALTDTPSRVIVRHLVAGSQVAVAFCLLVMATLMLRTAWHQAHLDLGFDARNVLTANITLHERAYPSLAQRRQFFDEILQRVRQMPGVTAAGFSGWLPFRTGPMVWIEAEGAADARSIRATLRSTSTGYFEALSIAPIEGRLITDDDRAERPRVAIIGRAFAREIWPERSAVGQRFRIRFGANDRSRPGFGPYTVIGVVDDTRQSLVEPTPPQMYTSFNQEPLAGNGCLHIKTTGQSRDLIPSVRSILRAADPTLPLDSALPLETIVEQASIRPEFLARALTVLAAAAVCVAIAGLYAVTTWLATQRQREAAVRLALGAPHSSVVLLLARAGVVAVTVGLIVGWIAAAPLTSLLASELRGVSPSDSFTRLVVAAGLAMTSLLALVRPAHRAAKWDASRLLRAE